LARPDDDRVDDLDGVDAVASHDFLLDRGGAAACCVRASGHVDVDGHGHTIGDHVVDRRTPS
jgi:hypothetical protein